MRTLERLLERAALSQDWAAVRRLAGILDAANAEQTGNVVSLAEARAKKGGAS